MISKQIPSIEWVPEFVIPDENETGGQINLNTSEWILLSKIDGRRSLKAIAEAADLSISHTGRLLYGLVSTKLIRLRAFLSTGISSGGSHCTKKVPSTRWDRAARSSRRRARGSETQSPFPRYLFITSFPYSRSAR